MGIRISDVLYLLQQLSPLFWAADLYRIPISREDVFPGDTWGQLVAPIKVGNYDTYALIDTGTPLLFFIWRHWFEGVQPGGCKLYVFGCYECSPDVCTKGDETTFKYDNDYTVTLFRQQDTLSLGASSVPHISFGLVTGVSKRPWASLGLAPQTPQTHPYRTLIDQLAQRRLINETTFSIYLKDNEHPKGELLLGGSDPAKYRAPLKYIQVSGYGVSNNKWSVELRNLKIGQTRGIIITPQNVDVDTGTNHLIMPDWFKRNVLNLLRNSGQKPVTISEDAEGYLVKCSDTPNLPSMTYIFVGPQGQEVPLRIPPTSLFRKSGDDVCRLLLYFTDDWLLGINAFIGHYFSFHWTKRLIGFSEAV